jgi:Ca2+-binding EF-hand superfamily protein
MKSKMFKTTMLGALLLATPFALAEEATKPKKAKGNPFVAADTNNDGKLDAAEFVAMNKQNPNPDAVKKRFNRLDTDKDGFLSPEEIQAGRKQGEKKRENADGEKKKSE